MTILTPPPRPASEGLALYAELCRRERLEASLRSVMAHVDSDDFHDVSFEPIRTQPEMFLNALQRDLQAGTYRPGPVSVVHTFQESSFLRTIPPRDRVVCVALLHLLKADLDIPDAVVGRALAQLAAALSSGRYAPPANEALCYRNPTLWVLLRSVVRRVGDKAVLDLLRSLFRAPVTSATRWST